jgi:aryl-alcohol dehydrogenase-like predicted oxidoreductase
MKLALGTVQFGLPYGVSNKTGQVAPVEVVKILDLAATKGMRILDTASGYGNSESVLGMSFPKGHGFSIVTKTLPVKADVIRQEEISKIEAAFERSLRHLGQPSVYGLLVHHSSDLLNPGGERLYESLLRWRSEGRVSKIGVSIYTKDECDRLFDQYAFDIVQLPLNVYDQRLVRDGTLKRLHANGVEVHVRSVFLQGVLLMPSEDLPEYLAALKPIHEDYILSLVQAGVSPLAAALGYLHQLPEVSAVLVGVENSQQLQECLDAAGHKPSLDFQRFAVDNPLMLDPRVWR